MVLLRLEPVISFMIRSLERIKGGLGVLWFSLFFFFVFVLYERIVRDKQLESAVGEFV